MVDLEAFKAHLEWAEGRENKIYQDSVGKWTIGVGRNLTDRGLTDDEVDYLLRNDMDVALRGARTLPYWDRLDPARQLVVADLVYNLGLPRFKKFVLTNQALERGDYREAARQMIDSKWYIQTKRRARKLVRIMFTGKLDGPDNPS